MGGMAGASALAHVIGWVGLAAVGVAVLLLAARHPRIALPLAVAFGLRVLLALVQAYGFDLPDSTADALRFESYGRAWAEDGVLAVFQHAQNGAYAYSFLIALVYAIAGPCSLLIQAVNVLAGTVIVFNVHRIAGALGGDLAARRAIWVAALYPTLLLYSAIILREALIGALFTTGMVVAVRGVQRDRLRDLGIAALWVAAAAILHTGMLLALAGIGVSLVGRGIQRLRQQRLSVLLAWVGLAVVLVGIGAGILLGWGGKRSREVSPEWIANQQRYLAESRAAYLPDMQPQSWLDIAWQTPVRVAYFVFAPFPWSLTEPADLFGVLDSLLYLLLGFGLVRTLAADRRRPDRWMATWVILALVAVFALMSSNYGTAIRHRGKTAPLMIALAAIPRRRPDRPINPPLDDRHE